MILLTGATGTIGSELVKLLAPERDRLRVMSRDPERAAAITEMGIEVVLGDLDDPASLGAAFSGIDKLFLLTSPAPQQVQQHSNAIEAAQRAGVGYIVRVSVIGAGIDAPFQLGRWHGETDRALADSGVAYTILQPHSFMQNLLASAPLIATTGELYANGGNGKFAAVDARDVAAVASNLLLHPGREGKTYTVTGPEPISYRDMATDLSKVLGRPVRYVDLPAEQMQAGMVAAGLPEWLAQDLVALNEMFGAGRAAHVSTAVPDITGRAARPFTQFARDYADAFEQT